MVAGDAVPKLRGLGLAVGVRRQLRIKPAATDPLLLDEGGAEDEAEDEPEAEGEVEVVAGGTSGGNGEAEPALLAPPASLATPPPLLPPRRDGSFVNYRDGGFEDDGSLFGFVAPSGYIGGGGSGGGLAAAEAAMGAAGAVYGGLEGWLTKLTKQVKRVNRFARVRLDLQPRPAAPCVMCHMFDVLAPCVQECLARATWVAAPATPATTQNHSPGPSPSPHSHLQPPYRHHLQALDPHAHTSHALLLGGETTPARQSPYSNSSP